MLDSPFGTTRRLGKASGQTPRRRLQPMLRHPLGRNHRVMTQRWPGGVASGCLCLQAAQSCRRMAFTLRGRPYPTHHFPLLPDVARAVDAVWLRLFLHVLVALTSLFGIIPGWSPSIFTHVCSPNVQGCLCSHFRPDKRFLSAGREWSAASSTFRRGSASMGSRAGKMNN